MDCDENNKYNTLINKALVSVHEIVSTELYTHSTNRIYTKTTIKLPKYKVRSHQFMLSIYNIHFSTDTLEHRLAEASEVIQVASADTNDFVVILGDTNAFPTEIDSEGKKTNMGSVHTSRIYSSSLS